MSEPRKSCSTVPRVLKTSNPLQPGALVRLYCLPRSRRDILRGTCASGFVPDALLSQALAQINHSLQVHLSYGVYVPLPKRITQDLCYWMGSTSSIRLISPPLLSRAGNETASLLDRMLVVQRSPAHQGSRLRSCPGKHNTYPQPFCRISKWSGINCSPASNSLIDVISN